MEGRWVGLSRRLADGKNNPVPGASPERTPPAASSEGRIDALDAGRGVAICGVILVHVSLWIPDLPHWLELVASMGQYGVQLFFVISAVTITLSLDDDAKRFGGEPVTIAQRFYIKRFFRIAPLYYVAILAYAIADYLARPAVPKPLVAPHIGVGAVRDCGFVQRWGAG